MGDGEAKNTKMKKIYETGISVFLLLFIFSVTIEGKRRLSLDEISKKDTIGQLMEVSTIRENLTPSTSFFRDISQSAFGTHFDKNIVLGMYKYLEKDFYGLDSINIHVYSNIDEKTMREMILNNRELFYKRVEQDFSTMYKMYGTNIKNNMIYAFNNLSDSQPLIYKFLNAKLLLTRILPTGIVILLCFFMFYKNKRKL